MERVQVLRYLGDPTLPSSMSQQARVIPISQTGKLSHSGFSGLFVCLVQGQKPASGKSQDPARGNLVLTPTFSKSPIKLCS